MGGGPKGVWGVPGVFPGSLGVFFGGPPAPSQPLSGSWVVSGSGGSSESSIWGSLGRFRARGGGIGGVLWGVFFWGARGTHQRQPQPGPCPRRRPQPRPQRLGHGALQVRGGEQGPPALRAAVPGGGRAGGQRPRPPRQARPVEHVWGGAGSGHPKHGGFGWAGGACGGPKHPPAPPDPPKAVLYPPPRPLKTHF